ncbi:hypothetical protein RvY_07520 [Ramazzottius varieornatus]|uniref:Protein sleepless n=1 Tax=Ramazzottius varieornatus TaxID=947166 RepID=A0A1D1V7I0_RAMVA|nr:hypothetical protein RvY_07520 [Ramazzottius varieornatus]
MQPLSSTFAFCLFGLWVGLTVAVTKPRGMLGPSILNSNPDDEEIIISSGQGWGSGSGHFPIEGFDQEDDDDDSEDVPSTRASVLKLSTPDSTRMSCIVCTTVGDESCRDPYIRNASHVVVCQSSVEGCLKVVTPSGDTYRNCLYGIFATAETSAEGCNRVKSDVHVGHKFVNSTICICRTNECNGGPKVHPAPTGVLPVLPATDGRASSLKNTPKSFSTSRATATVPKYSANFTLLFYFLASTVRRRS